MPQGAFPLPDPFEPAAADDLPDWLTGSDLDTSAGSDVLLARALELPDVQADLLERLGRSAPAPTPEPAPTPVPATAPWGDGWSVEQQFVPHDPNGPADSVNFRLNVTNRAPVESYECRCRFALPAGVKGARASGSPRRTAEGLEWELGTLAPGKGVTLLISLPLTPLTARFKSEPAVALVSTRPDRNVALAVTCDHAAAIPAGQAVLMRVAVENRGTGASGRLRVEAFQPHKTAAVAGADVEPLPGHGTRTAELLLPPAPPGATPCRIVVTTAGHPPVHTNTEYTTAAPDLALALAVPETVETDDEIACRLTVANRGAFPVAGVRAALSVPEELLFRTATNGGALALDGTRAEWEPFTVAAGEQWDATVRVAGFAPGRLNLIATASAQGAPDATAEAPLVCAVRRTVGGSSLVELLAGIAAPVPDEDDAPRERTAAVSAGQRHLMFRAAGARFAALLGDVREVLRPLPITPVPGAPAWLAGVTNVRGDIVPVVDLAEFLGLGAPDAPRGLVILCPEGEERVGLLVDDVLGIRPLSGHEDTIPGDDALIRFLAGVTLDPDGVVHRLDSLKLLAATEVAAGATA